MKFEKEEIEQLARAIVEQLHGCTGKPSETWHSAAEVPEAGLYIICTDKGAVYFAQPDGYFWHRSIKYWMRIPELPEEFKNKQ